MAEVIEISQVQRNSENYNRTKLKSLLKIWIGILNHKEFSSSSYLITAFKNCKGIDKL